MRERNLVFSRYCGAMLFLVWILGLAGGSGTGITAGNGPTWSELGSGMEWSVSALTVAPDGSLYVATGPPWAKGGGEFNYRHISKWNGSTWSTLQMGSGINGLVDTLAVSSNGTLYAGGQFTKVGRIAVNNIARWNGSTWSPLGSGVSGRNVDEYVTDEVTAISAASDGTIYAGGGFLTAGGKKARHVAKWDGSNWSALGSGVDGPVCALALAPDGTLYAAWNISKPDRKMSEGHVSQWKGSAWSVLKSGTNDNVTALAVAPDGTLYAARSLYKDFILQEGYGAKWNGSSWTPIGPKMKERVSCLAFAPNGTLYAARDFYDAHGMPSAGDVAVWNGSMWAPLGSKMNERVSGLALAPNGSIYAGGWFDKVGNKAVNFIAKWGLQ